MSVHVKLDSLEVNEPYRTDMRWKWNSNSQATITEANNQQKLYLFLVLMSLVFYSLLLFCTSSRSRFFFLLLHNDGMTLNVIVCVCVSVWPKQTGEYMPILLVDKWCLSPPINAPTHMKRTKNKTEQKRKIMFNNIFYFMFLLKQFVSLFTSTMLCCCLTVTAATVCLLIYVPFVAPCCRSRTAHADWQTKHMF